MGKKILIIEDEAKIMRTVRLYLEQAGYEVVWASDGTQGLATFRHEKPALMILDLNLPGELDGLDVCRAIRRDSNIPIIMLTARTEETDRLIGLELGADDYITKPFSPREVVARVRAVLRRTEQPEITPEVVEAADIRADVQRRSVTVAGSPVELTANEFDLLITLMRYPGRVYTRAQLLEATQGVSYEGYERTIDQHVKNLRQKIEPDPRDPRYILTVRSVGYKFTEG
ncbi:response regulator transcription factor [Kamptonema cortianum]|jgi:DNA-binding response OmpR family regulator|nr:response regulator transcription factor [Kamptonema cortianum]